MSGIAGIIRVDGGPAETAHVEGMTAAMRHRGPDGVSAWSDGSAALGHCTLRTTPEALEETQPLVSEDGGLVLVMDGRVDNWEELRAALLDRGARLRTRADAELVLHAFREWDAACVDRIEGDFALVVWEPASRRVFCARDRQGSRPFYYHWDGTRFSFASELHAILALPWVPEEPNEGMVAETLAYDEISRTETFWKGIFRLDEATTMTIRPGGASSARYWSPALKPEIRYRRIGEYAEHYREILIEAVRRQSRCNVGIGCEVSGGIDSSSVFALCDRLERAGRLRAPDVQGYTMHFGDGSAADEIEYARAVGTHLGRTISEIPPDLAPLEWYRDWADRYRDFPHYPNSVVGHGIHRAMRADGRRVVLTGYGGDEWQMGSPYYHADLLRAFDVAGEFRAIRDDWRAFGGRAAIYRALRFGAAPLLPETVQSALRRFRRRRAGLPDNAFRLSEPLDVLYRQRRHEIAGVMPAHSAPRHGLAFENLLSATRAHARESFNMLASSAGIETRDPMNSQAIIEFHFRTPDTIRQHSDEFRICHRTAMGDDLPVMVRNRASKADFSSTIRRLVPDIEDFDRPLLQNMAERWLRVGEVDRIVRLAREPGCPISVLWAVWGLFGCALTVGRVFPCGGRQTHSGSIRSSRKGFV